MVARAPHQRPLPPSRANRSPNRPARYFWHQGLTHRRITLPGGECDVILFITAETARRVQAAAKTGGFALDLVENLGETGDLFGLVQCDPVPDGRVNNDPYNDEGARQ